MSLGPGPEVWIWKRSAEKIVEKTGVHETSKIRGRAHSCDTGKRKVYTE